MTNRNQGTRPNRFFKHGHFPELDLSLLKNGMLVRKHPQKKASTLSNLRGKAFPAHAPKCRTFPTPMDSGLEAIQLKDDLQRGHSGCQLMLIRIGARQMRQRTGSDRPGPVAARNRLLKSIRLALSRP